MKSTFLSNPFRILWITLISLPSFSQAEETVFQVEIKAVELLDPDLLPAWNLAPGDVFPETFFKKHENQMSLLTAPRIVVFPEVEATITVQSEEHDQFFIQQPDGSYAMDTLREEERPGVHVRTSVIPLDAEQAEFRIHFRINIFEKRAPLPGVSLDVGKPLIQTSTIQTETTVPYDQWIFIGSTVVEEQNRSDQIMGLIKVTPIQPVPEK